MGIKAGLHWGNGLAVPTLPTARGLKETQMYQLPERERSNFVSVPMVTKETTEFILMMLSLKAKYNVQKCVGFFSFDGSSMNISLLPYLLSTIDSQLSSFQSFR